MGCCCTGGPTCCKNTSSIGKFLNVLNGSTEERETERLKNQIESLERELEWVKAKLECLKNVRVEPSVGQPKII